jgi:hypothetical protein
MHITSNTRKLNTFSNTHLRVRIQRFEPLGSEPSGSRSLAQTRIVRLLTLIIFLLSINQNSYYI